MPQAHTTNSSRRLRLTVAERYPALGDAPGEYVRNCAARPV